MAASSIPIRELKRAIAQQMRSLSAAGVTDLPQPDSDALRLIEAAASATPGSATEQSAAPEITRSSTSNTGVQATEPSRRTESMPSPKSLLTKQDYTSERLSLKDRVVGLDVLRKECAACAKCGELAASRTQTVFGVGNPAARLAFFGEAPGADEDRLGEPFVGRAGQLLTKIIEACTLTRDDVYILNVLRCRPPGNRNPTPDESANCRYFFESQLELIQPQFICCLGSIAATTLLETTTPIGRLRGTFHSWRGAKVLATYHPAYLLRNPSAKKLVWDDMQLLMAEMGIDIPKSD